MQTDIKQRIELLKCTKNCDGTETGYDKQSVDDTYDLLDGLWDDETEYYMEHYVNEDEFNEWKNQPLFEPNAESDFDLGYTYEELELEGDALTDYQTFISDMQDEMSNAIKNAFSDPSNASIKALSSIVKSNLSRLEGLTAFKLSSNQLLDIMKIDSPVAPGELTDALNKAMKAKKFVGNKIYESICCAEVKAAAQPVLYKYAPEAAMGGASALCDILKDDFDFSNIFDTSFNFPFFEISFKLLLDVIDFKSFISFKGFDVCQSE